MAKATDIYGRTWTVGDAVIYYHGGRHEARIVHIYRDGGGLRINVPSYGAPATWFTPA